MLFMLFSNSKPKSKPNNIYCKHHAYTVAVQTLKPADLSGQNDMVLLKKYNKQQNYC